MDDDVLARRTKWFEEYTGRADGGVSKPPLPGVRYPCPCCGYPMLSERGGYEICSLCGWEDDGQDDPHADEVWGGPNADYSLTEARDNFRRYLIMHRPADLHRRIGGGDSPTEVAAKRAIIAAFDAMPVASDADAREALWGQAIAGEAVLEAELWRKIWEHGSCWRRGDGDHPGAQKRGRHRLEGVAPLDHGDVLAQEPLAHAPEGPEEGPAARPDPRHGGAVDCADPIPIIVARPLTPARRMAHRAMRPPGLWQGRLRPPLIRVDDGGALGVDGDERCQGRTVAVLADLELDAPALPARPPRRSADDQ